MGLISKLKKTGSSATKTVTKAGSKAAKAAGGSTVSSVKAIGSNLGTAAKAASYAQAAIIGAVVLLSLGVLGVVGFFIYRATSKDVVDANRDSNVAAYNMMGQVGSEVARAAPAVAEAAGPLAMLVGI